VTQIGACGEHGGDPESIAFFNTNDIDYVSCSPFRIPVAKVAAAQAHIERSASKWEERWVSVSAPGVVLTCVLLSFPLLCCS
jgi:phosphoenolpyruvate-protein kinase (PTS system EI component)